MGRVSAGSVSTIRFTAADSLGGGEKEGPPPGSAHDARAWPSRRGLALPAQVTRWRWLWASGVLHQSHTHMAGTGPLLSLETVTSCPEASQFPSLHPESGCPLRPQTETRLGGPLVGVGSHWSAAINRPIN